MQEKEIILNNRNSFYRVIGEGPVVILLHGFGEDGTVWSNQFNAFPGFQLVIPDLPGSGRSEMIQDMSMEGLAEWLYQIMVAHSALSTQGNASGAGAVLIGHSMGGYIALAFVEKYPVFLSGLGLFHSSAFADSEEKKETRGKGIAFIEKQGAYEFLKTAIPNLYSAVTKGQAPWIIEEQIEASHTFSNAALVQYYASMMQRPDRTKILKTSKYPVLFILGKYDTAIPLTDGLRLCHLAGLSYIHILEKSGHMGMREEVKESNEILLNYLNSIRYPTQ